MIEALVLLGCVAVVFVVRVWTGHAPRWWNEWRANRSHRPSSVGVATVVNVVLIGALPWVVYLIIRPHLGSDAIALTVASGVPVVWAVVRWVQRRKVDAIGLIVIAAYACAVGVSLLFGNSATPIKLRDAGILALVGIACLVSVLLRRPLLVIALRRLVTQPVARERDLGVATAVAGAIFLAAALVEVLVMLTASTATFLAVAGPLGGLTPLAVVVVLIGFLRRRAPVNQP